MKGDSAKIWLKNKGAMCSMWKRKNEKNIDFFAVAGALTCAIVYSLRYTMKNFTKNWRCNACINTYLCVQNVSPFAYYISNERFFLIDLFLNDNIKIFIIFELRIAKKEWILAKLNLNKKITLLHLRRS